MIKDTIYAKAIEKLAEREKFDNCIKARICPQCGKELISHYVRCGSYRGSFLKCINNKRWFIYEDRRFLWFKYKKIIGSTKPKCDFKY